MNNVDVVAQFAHAGIAYGALLTLDRFHPTWFWYGVLAIAVWATLKEFWFDATYETPKQSFMNNLTDFLFYGLGTGLAIAAHFVGLLPKFLR